MSYTGNPSTNDVDALRLRLGDIYDDFEILADADYQYFLDQFESINRAVIPAAQAILFKLTRWTRERTGDIEVYGSDWAKQYRSAVLDMIKNPDLNPVIAMPYAGGISRSDMRANDADTDTVRPSAYEGMANERHRYNDEIVPDCLDGQRPLDEF